ncbi:hypothetical protein EM20IM_07030 [Candidatus Methylacidiphilum infernorum]|uniref:Uncharacterized protein n=2 Tax=Candidatus Methylacidiphilum infernorum TaxID=511746 RepID=A0ABX7PXP1_9BACT|nr:hypothetical protein EM20IM_07030 [Candidatus Methylacidiphilum infernorum]
MRFAEQGKRIEDLKEDVNVRFTELRADMNLRFVELSKRIEDLREDVNVRFAELRADVNSRFNEQGKRIELVENILAKAVRIDPQSSS